VVLKMCVYIIVYVCVYEYIYIYIYIYTNTHTHTHLLPPRSRVLLEKLPGFQLVKKFPAFYGTLRSITAFTSASHLSLS